MGCAWLPGILSVLTKFESMEGVARAKGHFSFATDRSLARGLCSDNGQRRVAELVDADCLVAGNIGVAAVDPFSIGVDPPAAGVGLNALG